MRRIDALKWTDADFQYDRNSDFEIEERVHIVRPDRRVLYDVSAIKHGARYSVHFCPKSEQIWVVDVTDFWVFVERTSDWQIRYSPADQSKGLPTARGYLVSCPRVREFGYAFSMPEVVAHRLLNARTKTEAGALAEQFFLELVNEHRWFPAVLVAPARKSSQQDDISDGIDFWVGEDVPVQIKYESFGGDRPGSGNLFFQTHTLPLRQARDWHGYEYAAGE